MDIRPLSSEDTSAVLAKALDLAAVHYPELIADIDAIHSILRGALHDPGAYTRVVGPKGAPQAALLATTGKNRWATRRRATVELWYSDLPGAGLLLMRDFKAWVAAQKNIVLAGMVLDIPDSYDARRIAERAGFDRRGGMNVFYTRGAKA